MSAKPNAAALLEKIRKRKAELSEPEHVEVKDSPEEVNHAENSAHTTATPRSKVSATDLLTKIRKRKREAAEIAESSRIIGKNAKNPYISDVPSKPIVPPTLNFRNPGWYQQQAKDKRALDSLKPWEKSLLPEEPPDREWWDVETNSTINRVCHPVEIEPPYELLKTDDALEVPLTSEQARKMRRKKRLLRQKESQDRIRLGLEPPPPPKLKVTNVAAVYGVEYLRDPTHYEAIARDSEHQRRLKHEEANENRQLSKDERWLKEQQVILEHRRTGLFGAAFRLPAIDSKGRFLVDASAKRLALTGVALILTDNDWCLVTVEGGVQEVRKYTKLLIRKLSGLLLWSGELKNAKFKRWSIHDKALEEAWRFMQEKKAQGYMNMGIDSDKL